MMLDRGYTSHEHLAEVGLIHMNGRLYDPVLRSFLMPDNFIQQPENTQNYNRYSYVLNNPLMYTDPSGEVVIGFAGAVIIGATIAALTYTVTALLADVPFSVGGLAKATFIGAASSAVTYGIGSASTSLFTNFYSQAAFSAVAHGTFQGSMTAISGGKFWSGFAAGALSSIAASAFGKGFNHEGINASGKMINPTQVWGGAGNFASSGAGMIAFGTVSGGAGAALTGGNFWQGAVTGLFVSGLNHYVHMIIEQRTIYGRLIDAGINDPYAAASYEGLNLKEFALKVFPDLMQQARNPKFEKREVIDGDPKILGLTTGSETNGNHTFSGEILLAKPAFSSYLKLASAMGHELKHAANYFNGNLNAWFRKGGESYRTAMDELQSYQWEANNGGPYNQFNLDSYRIQVELWNKLFNNFK